MAPPLRQQIRLSPDDRASLEAETRTWRDEGRVQRLWQKDPSIWTSSGEENWLGWLDVLDAWKDGRQDLDAAKSALTSHPDIRHIVVMGMGGSSLCPDLLARTFGPQPDAPELLVLDSTNPSQIASLEARIDLARSIFIVPSKSGTTIEPNSFEAYFLERVRERISPDAPGRHFIAITDPGTQLDERASKAGYAAICHGIPSIGGRFSALSVFGLVPAALMGLDVDRLVERARTMAAACGPDNDEAENPGLQLGLALGLLAKSGRDKLTLVTSPRIESLGGWLEQLIAESTGKSGVGIVPVAGEALAEPESYGSDRVFAHLRDAAAPDPQQDAAVAELEKAGKPVIRIELTDLYDITQEFFRWEIATAVAGAVLGVNPFDQPDVEAAKIVARELMARHAEDGSLPAPTAAAREGALSLFAPSTEIGATNDGAATASSDDLVERLGEVLASLRAGDYFAINAYLEMNEVNAASLAQLRHSVGSVTAVATTLGFGPRFLHSTGQLHKGGPATGVFLQLTADAPTDLSIPGQSYSFGTLESAQAAGDFQVLAERGRRVLHIHIHGDLTTGLEQLQACLERALERK